MTAFEDFTLSILDIPNFTIYKISEPGNDYFSFRKIFYKHIRASFGNYIQSSL